jgi:hypothetical protein
VEAKNVESDQTPPETHPSKRGRSRNGDNVESAGSAAPPAQNPAPRRHARNGQARNGRNGSGGDLVENSQLKKLLAAMSAAGNGDFSVRLAVGVDDGILGRLAEKFN